MGWDIINKDILLIKREFEKLKGISIKGDKRIEIDFFIRGLEDDIKNDKDNNPDDTFKRALAIKKMLKGK